MISCDSDLRANINQESNQTETKTAFDIALARLDAEIATFEAAVAECCDAIQNFTANL